MLLSLVSPALCQGGGDDKSYVLRLRRVTDGADACVLLQRDGHYHFERVLPSKALIYEGSLSSGDQRQIQNLLGNDELRGLNQDEIPLHLAAPSRDELDLRVARSAGWQQLWFPDAASQETFHQSLDPLLKWFDTLPSGNRTQLSEDEGKNNCLPPRPEEPTLATRERKARPTPIKVPASTPDSYMLRIVFDELSPGVAKRTCAIIYPNGFYHLEKSHERYYSEGIYRPDIVNPAAGGKIKALVFEQFLDSSARAELRKLLDDPSLIASRHSTLPAGIHYSEANITMVYIPREGMVQQLAFTNYFGGENAPTAYGTTGRLQHIDSAADLISPLQKWMKANIEARKAARLKEEFGNNCVPEPVQGLPVTISSELAQVVPSDVDSAASESENPSKAGAESTASSPTPSPATPRELDAQMAAENEPGLSLRVTTRMVLVDVIATDKHGTAMTDLQRADFEVLEDGGPQEVKFFTHTSHESTRNEKRPPPALPPNVYSNRPDYSRPAGPLVLILLDGVNTASLDQAYARRQMLDYVRTLKSDQRVAILALTTDLLLLQDFTTDPQVLKAALEKFSAGDSTLLTRGVPAQISPQMAEVLAWAAPNPILSNLRRMNQEAAVNSIDDRVRVTLAALEALARAMMGYPGRKNLIWVSSGFPASIDLGGKNFALSQTYAGDLAEASKLLSQAQVSVYPVDARGLIGNLQRPPGSPGNRDADSAFSDCPDCEIVPTVESLSDDSYGQLTRIAPLVAGSHMAMQQIAQDTGGRAFYNGNNLSAAVAAGVADGSSYYTLGYYPNNKDWDGKFRKIVVKTERRDVRLRYRTGYYAFDSGYLAKSPDPLRESNRVRELVTAIKDPLPSTGVGFWAHLMPPSQSDPSSYVEFLVDANTISCAATGDKYECDLDYAVLTVTSNGGITSTVVKTVQASLPASAYTTVRKRGLPYRVPVKSLPEHGSLRLAVRDNATGLLGTLTVPIPSSFPQTDQAIHR